MKAYCCLFLGLFLLASIPASAQVQATIVGTVTDPSGAAVPGANITIVNAAKGFTHRYTSNSAGEYTGAGIPIGEYKVEVEAAGFQRLTRSSITLDAGQTLRVDLSLTVGAAAQSVDVSGNVPKVETDSSTISGVITGSQVSQLSIQARNFANLALLVPGAASFATFALEIVQYVAEVKKPDADRLPQYHEAGTGFLALPVAVAGARLSGCREDVYEDVAEPDERKARRR